MGQKKTWTISQYEFLFLKYHELTMGPIVPYATPTERGYMYFKKFICLFLFLVNKKIVTDLTPSDTAYDVQG